MDYELIDQDARVGDAKRNGGPVTILELMGVPLEMPHALSLGR